MPSTSPTAGSEGRHIAVEIDPTFDAELKNAEGKRPSGWRSRQGTGGCDATRRIGSTGASARPGQGPGGTGEAIAALDSSDAAIERAKLDLEFSK
jgi:hypothetical protein